MSDPNLRAPVGRLSARRVDQGAGPSPGDEHFEAFESEQPPPSATAGQQPHASTAFGLVDVAEWCDEVDPLSLFSSEVPIPPRRIDDDVRPVGAIAKTAPVEPLLRISTRVGASPRVPVPREAAGVARARVGRRTFPSRATLGVLAFVIGVGGGAAIVVMVGFGMRGGSEPASVTPVAASSDSSGATAIATAVARPEASLLAVTEPRDERTPSSGKRAVRSPPIVPAAAASAAVRNADVGVAAAPAPVRNADGERGTVPTTTVRAASEPSRPRSAAVVPAPDAAPSASAPSAALPAVTSRTISPASAGGAAAVPGIVATAGTLPSGATPTLLDRAEGTPIEEPALSGPSSVLTTTAVIESVLSRYAAAFSARDVAAARAVWPGVNERGLVRAFESVEEQQFDLGECVITANPPRAVASCDGTAKYVPKVGSKRVRSEPRHWTFRLEQQRDGWSIETVDFR